MKNLFIQKKMKASSAIRISPEAVNYTEGFHG